MQINKLYPIFFCFLLFSCKEGKNLSCDIGKENAQRVNINTKKGFNVTRFHCPSLISLFTSPNITTDIEPQFTEIKGKPFFCYFTKKLELKCKNILDTVEVFTINTSSFLKNRKRIIFLFQKDTLHFIDMSALEYHQFKFENDSLKKIIEHNFTSDLEKNDFFIYRNTLSSSKFIFSYPHLILPYGSTTPKISPSYMDSTAFLSYNLLSKKVEKIIKIPCVYKNNFLYTTDKMVVQLNNVIYATFSESDIISSFDIIKKKEQSFLISHNCNFQTFNLKKEQDLAYIRKFTNTNELNTNLLVDKKENIILLKHSYKERFSDTSSFQIFCYDKKLNQTFQDTIRHSVFTYGVFAFKAGFVIVDAVLKNFYYYEAKIE